MKRFIRYLYEYEQGRRLRNVGFVKVERGDRECTLHIHGKGLHMKGERELALYLFYGDGDECVGIWQGTVDNVNPAINYRLYYTEEDVGSPENFEKINGIVLESELGRRYAVVWNDTPVDVGRIRLLSSKESREVKAETEVEIPVMKESEEDKRISVAEEDTRSQEVMPCPNQDVCQPKEDNRPQDRDMQPQEELLRQDQCGQPAEENEQLRTCESQPPEAGQPQEELLRQDQGGQPSEDLTHQEQDQPSEDAHRADGSPQSGSACQCTKIQRNDLARLPRCEWKWANNSFLLHGYYNYHHLALIDDGNRFMLGVPGIYHPQEAKAANVFGFVEFIPAREIKMDLTDDEGCSQEQFGYWCRPVKRPLKM